MSYLALYRKYRPKDFDDFVGQEAVVTTLRNQVRFNQLGHAYLFCGTRGTGKTSAAKVFAKAVNCLSPRDGNPCNQCKLCLEAEQGFNLVEIDAASNNGVDNIRDLREEVQYTPSEGKYKVYIIDEVHMLSTSAFNALLKTLEEPPEHVIFVLATTDPQKVLPTIISRCQRYDFKRIITPQLTEHLKQVCAAEGIEAKEDALNYIAMMADGGCRDALSILDQCHAYYIHDAITLDKAREMLGAVDDRVFTDMTEALIEQDTVALLRGVEKVFDNGRDALQFLSSWSGYLRDLMVARVLGEDAEQLLHKEVSTIRTYMAQAERAGEAITGWIEDLASLEAQLKGVLQRRVLMEIGMIRMVNKGSRAGTSGSPAMSAGVSGTQGKAAEPSGSVSSSALRRMERRIEQLEGRLQQTGGVAQVTAPDGSGNQAFQTPPTGDISSRSPVATVPVRAIPTDEDTQRVLDHWEQIRKNAMEKEKGLSILSLAWPEAGEEPGTLFIRSDKDFVLNNLKTPDRFKLIQIENAIADETGKRFHVLVGKPEKMKKGVSHETLNMINMKVDVT
ncbi:MAG: DNA polymerase III subunit gamma/tau [Lachnospiraceae bacterium]|nr:DNA polymerase III subunit gamma/tau [Lachnospiraceae bacterium]